MKNQNLKQTSIGIMVLMILSTLVYGNGPGILFKYDFYILGICGLALGFMMFVFASYDFRYIIKHTKGIQLYGESTQQDVPGNHKTTFILNGYGKVTVHLDELDRSSRYFLGRWTVYTLKGPDKFELWHDHPFFGGKWYFVKHS